MSKILTTSSYFNRYDAGFADTFIYHNLEYQDTDSITTSSINFSFDPDNGADDKKTEFLLCRFIIGDQNAYGIPANAKLESVILRLTNASTTTSALQFAAFRLNQDSINYVEGVADGITSDGAQAWDIRYDAAAADRIWLNQIAADGLDNGAGSGVTMDFDLKSLVQFDGVNFGSVVDVAVYLTTDYAGTLATLYGTNNTTHHPKVAVVYSIPKPTSPQFKVTSSVDGTSALIKPIKHAESEDLQSYIFTYHTTSGSLAYNANAITTTDFGAEQYESAKVWAAGTPPLAVEDETYHMQVFAQDSVHTNAASATSNKFSATRPNVTSVTKTGFANTGDSGTITVTADTSGDWAANGAGSLKYLYVLWDGPATGATIDDDGAAKIEITTANATSISRSHTFSTTGSKYIWVALEDTFGFRTGFHRIDDNDNDIGGVDGNIATPTALPNPSARTPLPVAIASKKTHLHTAYGLIDAANTLNGIKSLATSSDAEIYYYNWKHGQDNILVTAFSSDNDNQHFDDQSRQVKVKCNWGTDASSSKDMSDAVLTVYGLASFYDNAGTETKVADNNAAFTSDAGYYRYTKEGIQPNTTQNGYGSDSQNYWKTIDQIVVTTAPSLEGFSFPNRYLVATTAGDTQVVNSRISSIKNHNLWGNFAEVGPSNATVNKSSNYVEKTGGSVNFFEQGFQIGDKVYVDFTSIEDGIYTVSTLTATKMTFTEAIPGSGTVTEDVDIWIDTRRNAAIPYSTYSTDLSSSTTFTLTVSQNRDNGSRASTTIDIFHRIPQELDLDTYIDGGNIALMDAGIERPGGISGKMPVGDRLYPIGIGRTNPGLPSITTTFKVLDQTGLRVLWNLLEGNRYDWCLLESDRIDSPALPHRTFVLKMQDGSLKRDGASGKHYTARLRFMAIGEEV